MNIGVFIKEISPEAGGGFTFQETVINGLASANRDHQITIFHYGCTRFKSTNPNVKYQSVAGNPLSAFVQKLLFEVFGRFFQRPMARLSSFLKIGLPYPYGSPLDRVVRKNKCDFVIFPTPEFERVEAPYACTVWDLEHRAQPYFPEVSARGQWDRREGLYTDMLRRASYVITGTETGKKEISQFYGISTDRIRLLPHPTPSFVFGNVESGRVSDEIAKRPYILYPAQFWAHKNHFTLLSSLAKMKQKVNLVFVGSDKGNLSYIKDQAFRLGLTDQAHFLGFVSRPDLVALYKGALAMVYPSLCGPENLPPLEAFALGCPVIASRIPGSMEQLGDAALLVSGDDPAEMASAVDLLIENQNERQKLIEKGKARATFYTDKEFVRDLNGVVGEFSSVRKLWNQV